MYKTELHCHTKSVSKCGKATPEEAVEFYLQHGYTTVVLTEHLNKNTFLNPLYGDQSGWDWETKVNFFWSGYEKLREAAAGRLYILPGCEYRSFTCPSDYHIYGITKEFMLAHPELPELEIKQVYPLVHEAGFLFIQAHPFRDGQTVTRRERIDGIEVWNGNTRKDNRNDIASFWADRYGLIKTSGTDYHASKPGKMPIGIETEAPITSNEELLAVLRSGNYRLLRNYKADDDHDALYNEGEEPRITAAGGLV